MNVVVDGQSVPITGPPPGTLRQLCELLSQQLPGSRLVVEANVDGERLDPTHDEALDRRLGEALEVAVVTCGRDDVVARVARQGKVYLEALDRALETTARHLRVGEIRTAARQLPDCISALAWTVKMLRTVASVSDSPPSGADRDLETDLRGLSRQIEETTRAQEGEDWVLLADQIEYELLPFLRGPALTYVEAALPAPAPGSSDVGP